MKRVLLSLFSLILIASMSFGLGTAFSKVAFQGYLTDANGDAITGTPDLTLTIYDALTGGNTLFTEIQTDVTVTNGVFDLIIGDVGTMADDAIFSGDIQYLGISVDGGTELSPRTQLVMVPYAFTASKVTGESVYVKNEGAQDLPIYAQNTQGVAIYARGGSGAGVFGTTEATNGYGTEGHALGDSGVGAYGQAHNSTGYGVYAVNTDATTGNHSGAALYIQGKINVEAGETYSSIGRGQVTAGTTGETVANDNVTDASMIILTVNQDTANTNGGVRIHSRLASNYFFVGTMDGNVASSNIGFYYLIIN